MEQSEMLISTRGITDDCDRLLSADDALAELQANCGGAIPGPLAIPELLDLVIHSRKMNLRIARKFSAFDGVDTVTAFARITPYNKKDGGGCELLIDNWNRQLTEPLSTRDIASWLDKADRAAAEIILHLDAKQRVQFVNAEAPDTQIFQDLVAADPAKAWSDYVALRDISHQQPLHWRLLDGARCEVPGSTRDWRVRMIPIGPNDQQPLGFELLLIADEALPHGDRSNNFQNKGDHVQSRLIGSALTPVLRQPIARVIANAETIRAKLAGPLKPEYSDYAGNIASAGQHLSAMLDDLADLEVVESPNFSTVKEKVRLSDAAHRAAGILGVRARARGISLNLPDKESTISVIAEFRRVLQILINLIGNAIAYSPDNTQVTVSVSQDEDRAILLVSDQGPGVSDAQAAKIFEKFERLGRESDGGSDSGSGLGLYISRKLALAMGGDLELQSGESEWGSPGATFMLTLPVNSE